MANFSHRLKQAKVIPLFKGGRKDSPKNYRPISILSPIGKIIEKAAANRMVSFLQSKKFFSNRQFAYQKRTGTNVAVLELIDTLYKDIDDGKISTGLFVDFSKAFDCLCHDKLLAKLSDAGIRGLCYDLLKSYLSGVSYPRCTTRICAWSVAIFDLHQRYD